MSTIHISYWEDEDPNDNNATQCKMRQKTREKLTTNMSMAHDLYLTHLG